MKYLYDNIENDGLYQICTQSPILLECYLLEPCMAKTIELIVGLAAKLRQLALCHSLHSCCKADKNSSEMSSD